MGGRCYGALQVCLRSQVKLEMIALLLIVTGYGLLLPLGAAFPLYVLVRKFRISPERAFRIVLTVRLTTLLVATVTIAAITAALWALDAAFMGRHSGSALAVMSSTVVDGASRLVGRLAVWSAVAWYALVAVIAGRWMPASIVRRCGFAVSSGEPDLRISLLRRNEAMGATVVGAATLVVWHELVIGALA